jgi:hypothetical protein
MVDKRNTSYRFSKENGFVSSGIVELLQLHTDLVPDYLWVVLVDIWITDTAYWQSSTYCEIGFTKRLLGGKICATHSFTNVTPA